MTEEELKALYAKMLRESQGRVDMLSQSAMSPEQLAALAEQSGYDGSSREAMAAALMRGGQEALYSQMPQGKTVGDIYVAPTWSESLNGAAQKLIGGYQMGQARKESQAIDEQQKAAKAAAAQVAVEAARKKELGSEQRNLQTLTGQYASSEAAAARLKQQQANADAAAARFQQGQSAAESRFQQGQAATANRFAKTLAAQDAARRAADERARQDRNSRENIANTKLLLGNNGKGGKGGDGIDTVSRRRLKQEESVFGRLGNAVNEAKDLQDKGQEIGRPGVDYVAEKAASIPIGGETASNYVTTHGYSKDEMDVRGKLDNAVEQYRRAFTGANLTLIEKSLGKNWDPTANGISTQEKITRTENLMEVLNANREAFSLDKLEPPTRDNAPANVDDMDEAAIDAELERLRKAQQGKKPS